MKKLAKLSYLLLAAFAFVLANCQKSSPPPPAPTGDFTFSPANPTTQTAVSFTATAQNATSFQWTSDPPVFTANTQNPTFTFTQAGTYQVTLTITGAGGSIRVTKAVTVVNPPPSNVDFSFTPATPEAGQTVNFTAVGQNVTSYQWSSNPAGFSSTQQNPSHAFATAGTYQITLVATGAGGSVTVNKNLTVTAPRPTADFTFTPASPRTGEAVTFTATATNANQFQWSSNPTGFSSTQQNPTHTFTTAGTYQITLVATGPGGSVTVNKNLTVTPAPQPAPTASFTFSPASPEEGEEVTFTATTTNTTSVTWSFGSPAIPNSTQNNPRVTYATAGTYTVTLTARGPGGEVQARQTITVRARSGGGGFCAGENPCNLPLCFPVRSTLTISGAGGGTGTFTYEYTTISGNRLLSRFVNTLNAGGFTTTTTTTLTYDSQGRNIRSTTTVQSPFSNSTTVVESEYNGCRKTRDITTTNGVVTGSATYEYDSQGRLIRITNFNAANQQTGYSLYENFNAQGQPQTERQFEGSGAGTLTATITTTYTNCQPTRIIGRNAAGATISDITNTLDSRNLIIRTVTVSTTGGVSTTATQDITYECQ
jgi:YD repeat-containing protein